MCHCRQLIRSLLIVVLLRKFDGIELMIHFKNLNMIYLMVSILVGLKLIEQHNFWIMSTFHKF